MSFSSDDFAKALEQYDYQLQKGQVVSGTPVTYDSDGVYVDVAGKSTAFLPMSEVSLDPFDDLTAVLPLNEERKFLVTREQNADGQVTLSLKQLEIQKAWDALEELQENNQTAQVRITGTNKGGVTLTLKGIRGFIPRSHLDRRADPETLVGQTVTAAVLEINRDRRKLVLSQRMATQASSLSAIQVGQLVEGRISGIKPFGVFVDFEGTTGLLHINRISNNYIASLQAFFESGQPIKTVIVDIDTQRNRVSLSTRVLENYPGEVLEKFTEVMDTAADRMEKVRKQLEKDGVLVG